MGALPWWVSNTSPVNIWHRGDFPVFKYMVFMFRWTFLNSNVSGFQQADVFPAMKSKYVCDFKSSCLYFCWVQMCFPEWTLISDKIGLFLTDVFSCYTWFTFIGIPDGTFPGLIACNFTRGHFSRLNFFNYSWREISQKTFSGWSMVFRRNIPVTMLITIMTVMMMVALRAMWRVPLPGVGWLRLSLRNRPCWDIISHDLSRVMFVLLEA